MTISPNASTVWRNYETDGVPSSGNHKVKKSALRTWGTAVETVIGAFTTDGGLIFATKTLMNAQAATYTEPRSAWVYADSTAANNGVYVLNPTTDTWTKVGSLPYDFVIGTDTGAGTANAIQITTDIPVADGMIVAFSLFEATTSSPVTVSINGGSLLTLKTNRGADASALTANMEIWGRVRSSDNTLRLLNDQDVSALVAQAEAAQAAAEEARDEAVAAAASQADFDTEVLASAATIGAGIHAVRLNGSASLGDGLGGLYISTNNGSADTFSSNGGTRTWYRALFDLPPIASGDTGKIVAVNATEDGFELGSLVATLPAPAAGDAGKVVAVNATEDGFELEFPDGRIDVSGGGANRVIFDASALTANRTLTLPDANVDLSVIPSLAVRGFLHVRDVKASGTSGGSSIAGTQRRTLNTVVTNSIAGASLASDQITLPAGTYRINASAPARAVGGHQAFLRTAGGTTLLVGTTESVGTSLAAVTCSLVNGIFTLAAPTAVELAHYTASAASSTGLGGAAVAGYGEVYTDVLIERVS